jgi:Zn-dependent protease with chaperone function
MLGIQFKELVEELEESSKDNEAGYRIKVAILAALGYVYVIGVVALLVGALWLLALVMKDGRHLVLLKFAVPMALLALVGFRALWVRLDPPEGTALTRDEAPQLFTLLDRIRKRLKGPPIHHVVMDDEYNAAIMQLPRFGLLGGSRNYLIIGLPLMQTLSVEQFAAVLSHEYGHLSGAHGHFSSWIYRVRMTWQRILDALVSRPMWGSGVFLHFFSWYVPYFEAYTFVLARSNEYEADRAAADVTSTRTMAEALVQVEIGARFVSEHFWPKFFAGADKTPAPAFLPYTQLPLSLNVGLDGGDAQAWLKAALLQRTGIADTHPSLKDRVAALGEEAKVPEKPASSAARALLGPSFSGLVTSFDKAWAKRSLGEWGERHRESLALKDRAAEISAKAKAGASLNAAELHDFARACERYSSEEKAEGYYRRALEVAPDHHETHLALGAMMVKRRNAEGIAHLDKAIPGGGETAYAASAIASRFLREAGRDRDAERYETKMLAQEGRERAKEFNKVYLMPNDNLAPHGLGDKELGLCRATFKRLHRVHDVHAVRKILPGAGEPYLVLVVSPRVGLFEVAFNMALSVVNVHPKEDYSVADNVLKALRLPHPYSVFIDLYLEDGIEEKVKAVEGSCIFDQSDR